MTRARPPRLRRWLWLVRGAAVAAAVHGVAGDASAQAVPEPAGVTPAPQVAPAIDISPRGAFLRNLAMPGWGHAAIGSRTRGGFYFAVEAATTYTLVRSRRRLVDVRERAAFRETFLRDQLAARGIEDPTEIESSLDQDGMLRELRSLEESRADQQEDMIALGIFVLFLSGADAYVSAHLARFPSPLELEAEPRPDGRLELSLRMPLPNGR